MRAYEPIVLDVDLAAQDFVEYWTFERFGQSGARGGEARRKRRAYRGLLVAGVVLSALALLWIDPSLAFILREATSSYRRYVSIPFELGVWASALYSLYCIFYAFSVWTSANEARYSKSLCEIAERHIDDGLTATSFRLTVSPEGVRKQVRAIDHFTAWREYAVIHETPTLIVSVLRNGDKGWIPKRVLGEGDLGVARTALIREWARAGGGGLEAGVYPYLSDKDVPCADCGYHLRGLEMPVCPECGAPVPFQGAARVDQSEAARD